MAARDRLVWIGLSTSGSDPESDRIEAIHVQITDDGFEVIAEARLLAVGDDPAVAEQPTLALVKMHVGKGRGLLAGVRVQEVRHFLSIHMPALFDYLHYRNIDIDTVRELVRRWSPEVHAARPKAEGRSEIAHAIEELRYYRGAAFVEVPPPAPAPTTE